MASTSIPGAIVEKFGTLSFSGKPACLWFGSASLKYPDETAVDLPIVEFFEETGQAAESFSHQPFMIRVPYRFEVFAKTMETAWAIAKGILWNGSTPDLAAGISTGGTLSYAANSYSHRGLRLMGWPQAEGTLDPREPGAGRVYHIVWRLEVSAEWVGG